MEQVGGLSRTGLAQLRARYPSLPPDFFAQVAAAAAHTREVQRQWREAHPYPDLSQMVRRTGRTAAELHAQGRARQAQAQAPAEPEADLVGKS
jgi:hypothetical protein